MSTNTQIKIKSDTDKAAIIDNAKYAKKGVKKFVQKAGSFLAGMIMPVVSILIAWGLLAAMFLGKYDDSGKWVKTGWFNFEPMGQIIGPTMKWLIPILIGYVAGNMVYGMRGGMLGAFVTTTAIIGNDFIYTHYAKDWLIGASTAAKVGSPNQIVGAMIIAPSIVWCSKKLEGLYIEKIKPGYEMLVRNFSMAFIAIIWAFIIFFSWGFVMFGISWVMVKIIDLFTKVPWSFPFMAIFTEPLRAVFLNNALNWGVMIPLGMQEVDMLNRAGKDAFSTFFMVGGNPGPGFGLLIAYVVWRKQQRAAAGGSSIIQLIGGIHEVHYVYILTEPIMVLATISGAFVSLLIVKVLAGGAITAISPGSMISVIAMSGSGYRIGINLLAIFAGAATSFGVGTFIMIFKRKTKDEVMAVNVTDEGIDFSQNNKNKPNINLVSKTDFDWKKAKLLMVACDAGMGSSAMAAGILRKWVKQNNVDIEVKNCAVKDLKTNVDIVVTMVNFMKVAQEKVPNAYVYPIKQFLGANIFDDLYKQLLEHKKILA